eukprot:9483514-Pyramimonas_sp.AAC.1
MGSSTDGPMQHSQAGPPPTTALRGPIGDSTKAPVVAFARGTPRLYSVSWPHREVHRRPQWLDSHAGPRHP